MSSSPNDPWVRRLVDLQRRIRDALRASLATQDAEHRARAVRDGDDGDTIFAIDVDAEDELLRCCAEWEAEGASFVVVAEGLEADGRSFGSGPPTHRLLLDPIDGTRGLMFDKRSAWSLAAVAPDRGAATRLVDIDLAVASELPTTRQARVDVLVARRGQGVAGAELDLDRGTKVARVAQPSSATTLRHGFATVCNFFQGGKELTSRIEEDLFERVLEGGWNAGKAEVYTDQYISSGGQLIEVARGHDRFVADLRPLVHRALGHDQTLCSRPYDVCTALIAREAGCVVTDPWGGPLDAPFDTTTNVAFVAYANAALAKRIGPVLADVLGAHGLG